MAKKLWIEDNEAMPAVVYADTLPSDVKGTFTEKTNDIESWDKYGKRNGIQFIQIRGILWDLILGIWNFFF